MVFQLSVPLVFTCQPNFSLFPARPDRSLLMVALALWRIAVSVSSRSQTLTTVRFFTASSQFSGKARTYESKPVPGSLDHIDPLAWAQRLFDLHEIRKAYTYSNEPSPVLMICRIRPIKGTTFFERAFLEKYKIGPKTKVNKFVLCNRF